MVPTVLAATAAVPDLDPPLYALGLSNGDENAATR